jgi:hypothetical protein
VVHALVVRVVEEYAASSSPTTSTAPMNSPSFVAAAL